MRKRWLLVFLIIYAVGIIGILVTACAYKGNVIIDNRDSFRFISPDLEPKLDSEIDSVVHHYDDDDINDNSRE